MKSEHRSVSICPRGAVCDGLGVDLCLPSREYRIVHDHEPLGPQVSSFDRDWMHHREAKSNVERQLRDMELGFLNILAEHQVGDRPPLVNEPDVSFDSSEATEDTHIQVMVRCDKDTFWKLFNAMMQVMDHGCEVSMGEMVKLGAKVVDALGRQAYEVGWLDEGEEN